MGTGNAFKWPTKSKVVAISLVANYQLRQRTTTTRRYLSLTIGSVDKLFEGGREGRAEQSRVEPREITANWAEAFE